MELVARPGGDDPGHVRSSGNLDGAPLPAQAVVCHARVVAEVHLPHVLQGEDVTVSERLHQSSVGRIQQHSVLIPLDLSKRIKNFDSNFLGNKSIKVSSDALKNQACFQGFLADRDKANRL